MSNRLVGDVEDYYDLNKGRAPGFGRNWFRVLVGFGERDSAQWAHGGEPITPFTAAEAEDKVQLWGGWQPVADALRCLESESSQVQPISVEPSQESQPQESPPQRAQISDTGQALFEVIGTAGVGQVLTLGRLSSDPEGDGVVKSIEWRIGNGGEAGNSSYPIQNASYETSHGGQPWDCASNSAYADTGVPADYLDFVIPFEVPVSASTLAAIGTSAEKASGTSKVAAAGRYIRALVGYCDKGGNAATVEASVSGLVGDVEVYFKHRDFYASEGDTIDTVILLNPPTPMRHRLSVSVSATALTATGHDVDYLGGIYHVVFEPGQVEAQLAIQTVADGLDEDETESFRIDIHDFNLPAGVRATRFRTTSFGVIVDSGGDVPEQSAFVPPALPTTIPAEIPQSGRSPSDCVENSPSSACGPADGKVRIEYAHDPTVKQPEDDIAFYIQPATDISGSVQVKASWSGYHNGNATFDVPARGKRFVIDVDRGEDQVEIPLDVTFSSPTATEIVEFHKRHTVQVADDEPS